MRRDGVSIMESRLYPRMTPRHKVNATNILTRKEENLIESVLLFILVASRVCLLSIQPIGQMLKASDDVRFNCSKQKLYAQSLVIAKCDAIRMVLQTITVI